MPRRKVIVFNQSPNSQLESDIGKVHNEKANSSNNRSIFLGANDKCYFELSLYFYCYYYWKLILKVCFQFYSIHILIQFYIRNIILGISLQALNQILYNFTFIVYIKERILNFVDPKNMQHKINFQFFFDLLLIIDFASILHQRDEYNFSRKTSNLLVFTF